jgi:hypothetical protein
LLCRSATTTADWISRIAADPAGERRQKKVNVENNNRKNKVLKADTTSRGKSRSGHGKATPRGKGNNKRQAEEEERPEAATEISDTVSTSQTAA